MKKNKNSTQEEKEQVMCILADIYYDRQSISWDRLKSMALCLYKFNDLGPKGTKEVAAYLYKIGEIAKSNYEKMNAKYQEYVKRNKGKEIRPQELYVNEKGKPLSLGEMDEYGNSIYHEIALLSKKMRYCIQDKSSINAYIFYTKNQIISQVMDLITSKEIDESVKEQLLEQVEILNELTQPEDVFRQIKKLKSLLEQNSRLKIDKATVELEEKEKRSQQNAEKVNLLNEFFYNNEKLDRTDIEQKAYAALARIQVLQQFTIDTCCKEALEKDIFDFQIALINGDIETIQSEITRFEDIFETSTRRSRR